MPIADSPGASPLARPAAPFTNWPVQLADPRFGYAWYAAPGIFLNQLHVRQGTVEVANALHDAIDLVVARERRDYERLGGLLIIHDWRTMRGYDKAARQVYLDRMRSREPGYLRGAVAILPDTPFLKMAVQTANVLMALRIGGTLALANEPTTVLTEHRVEMPTRRGWY